MRWLFSGGFLLSGILAIAGAYGEGHFLSWLTFPFIFVFSLIVNRDIIRAFIVLLSMVFLHESIWWILGMVPHYILILHVSWLTYADIWNWLFYPVALSSTLLYNHYYHPKCLKITIMIFSCYILLWLFGFNMVNTSDGPFYDPERYIIEFISWLIITNLFCINELSDKINIWYSHKTI